MKIAFIFAHPDDEAYGPSCTIAKLAKDNEVHIVSLCKGNRPGNEGVAKTRQIAFEKSCSVLGASSLMYNGSDCKLQLSDAISDVEHAISLIHPDVVYTHNISDVHQDHRLVAEACLIACRPKPGSSVKELYMCELPPSTDWSFGQIEPVFVPNTYVDVSDLVDTKREVLALYGTETYSYPDNRSIESVEELLIHRGKQVGVAGAEAFKQVFRIV